MTLEKPFGKDETIAALLAAADELFGQKGPKAVTVRDISRRANVNHALLHRHFGAKEALLDAIIEKHRQAFRQEVSDAKTLDDTIRAAMASLAQRPAFARIFAHLLLDERPLDQFVSTTGAADAIATAFSANGMVDAEARKFAAIVTAFGFGLVLFKDFATYAASSDATDTELLEAAIEMVQKMIESVTKTSSIATAS